MKIGEIIQNDLHIGGVKNRIMMIPYQQHWASWRELKSRLRCDKKTLYLHIKLGNIKAQKQGRYWMYELNSLATFLLKTYKYANKPLRNGKRWNWLDDYILRKYTVRDAMYLLNRSYKAVIVRKNRLRYTKCSKKSKY